MKTQLRKNQIICVNERSELRVNVGCLWITIAGDPNDYVIRETEHLHVLAGKLTVVEAIEDSEFVFLRPSTTSTRSRFLELLLGC